MSSMRSASSRTKISTCERSSVRWLEVVEQAPGRGDEDVDAAPQLVDLRLHADAAEDHHAGQLASACRRCARSPRPAPRARGSASGSGRGSAACRARRAPARLGHQPLQHRQRRSRRSCRCRSGRRPSRRAREDGGNGLRLDRGGRGVARFVNGTQQARPGRGYRKTWEFCQDHRPAARVERAPVEGRRGKGVGSDCVGADWKLGDASGIVGRARDARRERGPIARVTDSLEPPGLPARVAGRSDIPLR